MKKTEKIHIAGLVFHMDEDAYQVLKNYLNGIHQRFKGSEEGAEIIKDVESRIAELFQEKLQEKEVITMDDVNNVVQVMGEPEDFAEAATDSDAYDEPREAGNRPYKRLYRDPDNAIAGGVCAGLANYFNIDAVIIRVLFIIFFFISIGAALIVYLLLWIIIPKASTTAQKLEMRGERVDVSSIERRIKEEFTSVRDNVNRFGRSDAYNKTVDFLNELGNGLYRLLKVVLKVTGFALGILFIIAGMVVIVSLFVSLLAATNLYIPDFFTNAIPQLEAASFIIGTISGFKLLLVGILLVIGIPVILIIYLGIRIVFRLRDNGRIVGITSLIAWLVGIGILLFSGLGLYANFNREGQLSDRTAMDTTNAKAYHLKINEKLPMYADFQDTELDFDSYYFYWSEKARELRVRPKVIVKPSSGKKAEIVLRKKALGKNREHARRQASMLNYSWQQKDSLILLNPYFSFEQPKQWRFHELEVIVRLPANSKVYINNNLYNFLHYTRNLEDMWTSEMPGKLWNVTREGLALTKRENVPDEIKSENVDEADIERMKKELKNN